MTRRRTACPVRPARRGTILIVTMVLLLAVTAIAGAILQAAVAHARQVRQERRAVQVDRLAEAGLALAAVRLAADPGYDGETWTPALPDGDAGTVTIRVAGPAVESVAVYPAGSKTPAKARRSIVAGRPTP